MTFNVPSHDVSNISFGQGLLLIGPSGATPSLDVGAIRGTATLSITRSRIRVEQGAPRHLVENFSEAEAVTLTLTGIEWDLFNLQRALAAGTTSSTAAQDTLAFGGDPTFDKVAIIFRHRLPSGHTVDIRLWTAVGSGDLDIGVQDNVHEFAYTFEAVRTVTDWAGTALAATDQLFQIVRTKL